MVTRCRFFGVATPMCPTDTVHVSVLHLACFSLPLSAAWCPQCPGGKPETLRKTGFSVGFSRLQRVSLSPADPIRNRGRGPSLVFNGLQDARYKTTEADCTGVGRRSLGRLTGGETRQVMAGRETPPCTRYNSPDTCWSVSVLTW